MFIERYFMSPMNVTSAAVSNVNFFFLKSEYRSLWIVLTNYPSYTINSIKTLHCTGFTQRDTKKFD